MAWGQPCLAMSSTASKKTQENMNQKLGLVIKSGKYKLGKLRRNLWWRNAAGIPSGGVPGATA